MLDRVDDGSCCAPRARGARTGRQFLLAALLVAAGGCAATPSRSDSAYAGVVLTPALPKPDFTLTDTHGQPFSFRAQTHGALTLLYLGYTNCPDVCPVQMANIAAALQQLPFDVTSRVKVVFITTDPDRDTPEHLREWLDNFDRTFIGLRGTTTQVHAIEHDLNLAPSVVEETPGAGGYAVGHAAQVMAFTSDDSAHVVYPSGTRQADWARDLPKLADVK